jgi:transcriptional regulator with XRE-family HTH domain
MMCPPEHGHGVNGTCYVGHGCRCDDCKTGRSEYEFWRQRNPDKAGYIDATGTRRRLQALAALGWSARAIAERFGYSEVTVSGWFRANLVSRRTVARIRGWYDELSMTPPPTRTRAERYSVGTTRGRARAAGWHPPLAWDDDLIDDPNASPEPVIAQTAPPETRDRRVRELHRLRWSDAAIAEAVGVTTRTIQRDRDRLDLPGWSMAELRKTGKKAA